MIQFHAGNREVQDEANSRPVADLLASRSKGAEDDIPPRILAADIVLIAMADDDGRLAFQAVSGAPPLLQGESSGAICFPDGLKLPSDGGALAGGIAVELALRQRSRLNGRLARRGGRLVFTADETFANCRKYVAPSMALEAALHIGPQQRHAFDIDDPAL